MLFFFTVESRFFGVAISKLSVRSSERAKTSELLVPVVLDVEVPTVNGRECALAVAVLEEWVEDAIDFRAADVFVDFRSLNEFDIDLRSLTVDEVSIEPEEDSSRILSNVNSGALSVEFETTTCLPSDTFGT